MQTQLFFAASRGGRIADKTKFRRIKADSFQNGKFFEFLKLVILVPVYFGTILSEKRLLRLHF